MQKGVIIKGTDILGVVFEFDINKLKDLEKG